VKWLGAFLGVLLVATLALACEEEGAEEAATPTPSQTPTATATPEATPTQKATAIPEVTPTPEATLMPEATPTPEPTVEEIPTPEAEAAYHGWLTYTNDVYGYEFKYPPEATVTEAPEWHFKVPAEEQQQGVTHQDVYEQYTGKICISVDYELGYVRISAPVNAGFPYVICGRTGIAYQGRAREEILVIDGKTYTAGGWEEQGPEETLPYHNEMLLVALDDGTRIEYGAKPVETSTFEDYLETRDDLVRIVQSYRKLP
jgi:hypothetical protein